LPLGPFQHGWVVGLLAAQEPARDQLSDASGGDGAVIGRHRRFFAACASTGLVRSNP
jgi:hypothetical protein